MLYMIIFIIVYIEKRIIDNDVTIYKVIITLRFRMIIQY